MALKRRDEAVWVEALYQATDAAEKLKILAALQTHAWTILVSPAFMSHDRPKQDTDHRRHSLLDCPHFRNGMPGRSSQYLTRTTRR